MPTLGGHRWIKPFSKKEENSANENKNKYTPKTRLEDLQLGVFMGRYGLVIDQNQTSFIDFEIIKTKTKKNTNIHLAV